ncbi:MAG TPA: precorrin-3B C(17)-methyltransferase [Polyangia bacterium]|nr:precorrin-3B C(17)-methyltransferase [Polyangia bacterium]
MARVGRYKGAIVVDVGGAQWLVGNPKEPCAEVPDTVEAPYVRALTTTVPLVPGFVVDGDDGAALASALAGKLVIARNGSVSERLWRLVRGEAQGCGEPRLQWLADIPQPIWDIVREQVLRCS